MATKLVSGRASTNPWKYGLALSALLAHGCLAPIEERQPAREAEVERSVEALTPQQIETQVQQAFDDAACYCEAYVLESLTAGPVAQLLVAPSANVCAGDPRLAAFANRFRDPAPSNTRRACTLSASSPHGTTKPARWLESGFNRQDEFARNGCDGPVELLETDFAYDVEPSNLTYPTAGFCRADFNYCIAQQLRIKGESLARAPTNSQVKEGILEEAQLRFGMSSSEHLTTLEWVDEGEGRACASPSYEMVWTNVGPRTHATWSRTIPTVCERICREQLVDPRIAAQDCRNYCTPDPSSRVSECEAQRATRQQTLVSNGKLNVQVTKATSIVNGTPKRLRCVITESFSEQTWVEDGGCMTDKHDREQTRVKLGYGDVALARVNDAVAQLADVAELRARGHMARSDALTPTTASPALYGDAVWGAGSPREAALRVLVGQGPIPADAAPYAKNHRDDALAQVAADLLVRHRVALPYEQCDATGTWQLTGAPFEAHVDRMHEALARRIAQVADQDALDATTVKQALSHELGIARSHIATAALLLADRLTTLEVDYAFAKDVPASTCANGVLELKNALVAQRTPLRATTSAMNAGAGAPAYEGPVTHGPVCTSPDWYSGHRDQLKNVGVLGTLQTIRHRAMRLMQEEKIQDWSVHPELQTAENLLRGYAGANWSESAPALTGARVWLWWGSTFNAANGDTLRLVTNPRELYCQLHGHYEGSIAAGCLPEGATPLPVSPMSVFVKGPSPLVAYWNSPAGELRYVVWERCTAGTCTRELVDVLDPGRLGHVHSLGGKLGQLAARVLAKTPNNPAQPQFNSLNLPNDLVPPLAHPLIGQTDALGNPIEEAHAAYQREAELLQNAAANQLDEARTLEFQYLSHQHAVASAEDLAEFAQKEVLAEACGGSTAACAVPRVAKISLDELGLVPDPGPEPAARRYFWSYTLPCREFLREMDYTVPTIGEDLREFVEVDFKNLLICTRWQALRNASSAELFDLPVPVQDELQNANGTGTFSEYGGELRQQLISTYRKLDDMRTALRQFDTLYAMADRRLDLAISQVDQNTYDDAGLWGCYLKAGLKLGGTLAVTAGAIGATGGLLAVGAGIMGGSATLETLESGAGCGDTETAQAIALGTFIEVLGAMEQMRSLFDEAIRLVSEVASADAALDLVEQRAALAAERVLLERRIAMGELQGDPAWRALQGKKMQAARRTLFRAQQLAFVARRALEYRMAGDLRTLDAATPFSDAPSTWVNEVFTLHESVVSANGNVVSTAPEAISEYLEELRYFTLGYAFANPAVRGTERTSFSLSKVVGARTEAGSLDLSRLAFRCNESDGLWLGGHADEDLPDSPPCASMGGVHSLVVSFLIPSTLGSYLRSRLAHGNRNYRILKLGVNLDGAVRSCPLNDPECWAETTARYSLRQDGATMLESLEGEQRMFWLAPGVIQNVQGLAVDAFLPDTNWNSEMESLMRFEWRGRPLAGHYTLTLPGSSSLDLTQLMEVQFVLDYEFWTPQL